MTVNSNYKVLDGIITLMKRWKRVEEPRKEPRMVHRSRSLDTDHLTPTRSLSVSSMPPSASIFALFFALCHHFFPFLHYFSSFSCPKVRIHLKLNSRELFSRVFFASGELHWEWLSENNFQRSVYLLRTTEENFTLKLYSHRYDFDENYSKR